MLSYKPPSTETAFNFNKFRQKKTINLKYSDINGTPWFFLESNSRWVHKKINLFSEI